jgi:uncharacterized protein YggU (UPF0235/DUF167 family)
MPSAAPPAASISATVLGRSDNAVEGCGFRIETSPDLPSLRRGWARQARSGCSHFRTPPSLKDRWVSRPRSFEATTYDGILMEHFVKARVKAGAPREDFIEKKQNEFLISVREKAEGNRANTRIVSLIAAHFRVGPNAVRIISGHHRPSKILLVRI